MSSSSASRQRFKVYRASAGSGKTFTLTAEYIATLLSSSDCTPSRILAVTFTNKATAEMKERILQKLYALATETCDADFLEAILERTAGCGRKELCSRARRALHTIIHDYDHFYVVTIDSFFQTLLGNLAHELGQTANYKVDLDDKQVTEAAVDRMLGHLHSSSNLWRWIIDYIDEKINDDSSWKIDREIKELSRQLFKEKFLLHETQLLDKLSDPQAMKDYKGRLQALKARLLPLLGDTARSVEAFIAGGADGYAWISGNGRSVATYLRKIIERDPRGTEPSAALGTFFTDSAKWLRKGDQQNAELLARADACREKLQQLEDSRREAAYVTNSVDLALKNMNPLCLLGEISHEIQTINDETGRLMLAKTPQLFHEMVGESDAGFVFEKAGLQFRHIMIDEFQDTSALQWSNFRHLLVEQLASTGTCLLVGDIKQSIYRFRGGNWRMMAGIRQEFPHQEIALPDLDMNFRSTQAIVGFNNAFFPRAAAFLDARRTEDTLTKIYEGVVQKCSRREPGFVRVSIDIRASTPSGSTTGDDAAGDTDSYPLHELASEVCRLHDEGTPWNRMAILLRFKREGADIIDHFTKHYPDIPLVSDEAFRFSASPEIQLLIAALRYLHDASDVVARAYIVRQLASMADAATPSWNSLLENPEALLPAGFRDKRAELARLPLYELLRRLARLFRLEEVDGSAPYLYGFYDQVLAWLEDNASDIPDFLTFWDEQLQSKSISSGTVDGIVLATIHASKGLAYDHVFLPFCTWKTEEDKRTDILWCEPKEQDFRGLSLLPVTPSQKAENSIFAADYAEEHLQQRIENLNLLYVAFTRAKHSLYIWTSVSERTPSCPTIGDVILHSIDEQPPERTAGRIVREYPAPRPPYVPRSGACEAASTAASEEGRKNLGDTKNFEARKKNFKARKNNFLRDTEPDRCSSPSESANRLEICPRTAEVCLETFDSPIHFIQSGGAADFVDAEESAEERQRDTYISQGVLFHRILSEIRTAADIPAVLRRYLGEGILASEKEAAQIRSLLEKRLDHPHVRSWFAADAKPYNECSILVRDADGTARVERPDRVVVRGGQAVVIDYKLGRPKAEYRSQVCRYKEWLRRIGYTDIRGYLWYLYQNHIEEVD